MKKVKEAEYHIKISYLSTNFFELSPAHTALRESSIRKWICVISVAHGGNAYRALGEAVMPRLMPRAWRAAKENSSIRQQRASYGSYSCYY